MSPNGATKARGDDDRRGQDRLPTSLTVEILGRQTEHETYHGELLNLSHGGFGLRLERRVELQVRWASETRSSRTVDVMFRLPEEAARAPIEARCRVVWSNGLGEDRSYVGLEVVEFLGNGQRALEDFLADKPRSAP